VLAARVEAARLGPLAVSESSARGRTAPRPQWSGSDRTASGSRACGGTGKGGNTGERRRRADRPRLRARCPRGSSSARASGSFRVECPRWYSSPPAVERLRPDGVRVARLRWNGEGGGARGSDGVVRVVLASVLAARVGAARLVPPAASESSARGGTAPRPWWDGSDRTPSGSRACGGAGKGHGGATASCGSSSPPCSPPAWKQPVWRPWRAAVAPGWYAWRPAAWGGPAPRLLPPRPSSRAALLKRLERPIGTRARRLSAPNGGRGDWSLQ
jgi:hypothetical protein